MAFSSSSFFVGVGTVVAAIAVGFAGGAMITTSTVQPQNRLERVTTNAAPPSSATSPAVSSGQASQQANVITPPAQQQPQSVAAAPSPAADSAPVPQPQALAPVVAKIDATTNAQQPTNAQQHPPAAPPQTAKNEDAGPARNERASARPAELNREAARPVEANREPSHKRGDERKFVERKRRQDLDEATNVVRQMPRDNSTVDQVVEREDAPRIIDGPPRRFGLFGNNEDSPRVVNEPPPRFGLFGN
jgi:hypothetical protein